MGGSAGSKARIPRRIRVSTFESLILIIGILSPVWVVLIVAMVMNHDGKEKK